MENNTWILVPVTDLILHRVEVLTRSLPSRAFLRAGDAIHIVSAMDAGFREVWTNDRHLLAAATHHGLKGRSVYRDWRKSLERRGCRSMPYYI